MFIYKIYICIRMDIMSNCILNIRFIKFLFLCFVFMKHAADI